MHALARVRQSRAAGLLEEPLRVLAAELERLPQRRHLDLGRVSQGEPEQLVVGEALERALPVLDLLGLSLVEQEYREHVPLFSGNRHVSLSGNQRCRLDPPAPWNVRRLAAYALRTRHSEGSAGRVQKQSRATSFG